MGLKRANKDSTNLMILFLSFSNVTGNALNIVSGFFVAKWLLPEDLGTFSSFTILTGYIILVQLGIPSGLGRELPYYIGQGKKKEASMYAASAQFWQRTFGLAALLTSTLISLIFGLRGEWVNAAGVIVIGVTSWQALYITKYLKVLFRTNRDFNKLSWIKLLVSLTSFVGIIFVYYWGFYGLCVRAIFIAAVDFFSTYLWRPLKVKPKWNRKYGLELLKIGFPMYSVASIIGLWPLLQRTLIIALGGPKALGLFTLATLAEGSMKSVSSSLSSVIYPTMSKAWGEGAELSKLIELTKKSFLMTFLLFVSLAPIGWWLLPRVVEWALPNYSEGVEAAQWMLIVGCLGVFNVYGNIYNVVRDQKNRIVSYIIAVLVWLLFVYVFYEKQEFDLSIFPKAMALGLCAMIMINAFYIRGNLGMSNTKL